MFNTLYNTTKIEREKLTKFETLLTVYNTIIDGGILTEV